MRERANWGFKKTGDEAEFAAAWSETRFKEPSHKCTIRVATA